MKLQTLSLAAAVHPTSLPFVLSALLALVFNPIVAASAPANDNIANAQAITSDSFSVNGTEVGASQEAFETSPNFPYTFGTDLNNSVWYSYTPSVSGSLIVSPINAGTNGDITAVILFQGPATPTRSTYVGENAPTNATLTADVTAKQQYFLFVANAALTAHPFILNGTLHASVTAPVVTVTVPEPEAIRSTGAAGKVFIQLSSAPTERLQVAYTLKGTAVNGTDYALLTDKVTVPAGETKATIKIKPKHGAMGMRIVKVIVVTGKGYTLGSPHKGKVTIVESPGK